MQEDPFKDMENGGTENEGPKLTNSLWSKIVPVKR